MEDQKKWEHAQATYATCCRAMDNIDWHYTPHDEKLTLVCSVKSDDLPIEFIVRVDADRELVMLLSKLPFTLQDDKRLDVALAVSAVNNMLVHGCFDYSLTDGTIYFRLPSSFRDSTLGEEVFIYMLACASKTIDEYNDRLMMLGRGMISLEQFLKSLKQE